jgi:GNAT superfamily N-acetyltransferase
MWWMRFAGCWVSSSNLREARVAIERFTPDHSLWSDFCAHLAQHTMARWVLQPASDGVGWSQQPLPALYFLGSVEANRVVGHIALKMQRLVLPKIARDTKTQPLTTRDERTLRELFVQTFAVNEDFRNQGRGRMLQLAALDLCHSLGCYQMRSWSSAERLANYALKLSMGFAVHPSIQETADGQRIQGVYFVKTVTEF